MNAGITPNEECINLWETQLKVNPKIQGMMMKYDGAASFVLDRVFEKGFDFREIGKDYSILPKNEARFLVFDVPSNKENSKSSKFCLFAWIPSCLAAKQKFPFASSIGSIKGSWELTRDFNIDDLSGFDYDSICKELRLN